MSCEIQDIEPYGPYWVTFNFTDPDTGVTELIKHTYATEIEAIRCTAFGNYSNVKLVAHSDNINRSEYRY